MKREPQSGRVVAPKTGKARGKRVYKTIYARDWSPRGGSPAAHAVEDARQAGLLEGDETRHVSFRAPKALVDAAMREAGVTSPTELGVAGLAMIAQPDPVAEFFKRTHGRLGPDFDLEY
jgi:hypothetical protein